MATETPSPTSEGHPRMLLAFDAQSRLLCRHGLDDRLLPTALAGAYQPFEPSFEPHYEVAPLRVYTLPRSGHAVWFARISPEAAGPTACFFAIDQLQRQPLSPLLAEALDAIDPYLIEVPYLHLGESEYIYKFRAQKERNEAIYGQDARTRALYQSRLCEAIKRSRRTREATAQEAAALAFGPVTYLLPSHFGFCLGVKNAIERSYETLAAYPDRRVFMLSELIHNPYVNEDLRARGLRYLQNDRGEPYTIDDRSASQAGAGARLWWDELCEDDVVIIPAFGATDEDKKRLIRKGIGISQHDATCMLVEKVWKAARKYGQQGYTVIIHGKAEHEETKATFSNTRRYAPAVIIRNREEAGILVRIIRGDPQALAAFEERLRPHCTPGFDPTIALQRIALVNQTTLLVNETVRILDDLTAAIRDRYGEAEALERTGGRARKDTLCYATQVNQDALGRALEAGADAALVVGGQNSSNTFQLYRLCEARLGPRAMYVQSEANIEAWDCVRHWRFRKDAVEAHGDEAQRWETRSLPSPPMHRPLRIIVTGGASCPDGIIQQVIHRINSFFPADQLRDVEEILRGLED